MNGIEFVCWLNRRFPDYNISYNLTCTRYYKGKNVDVVFEYNGQKTLFRQGTSVLVQIKHKLTNRWTQHYGKCYEYIRDTINELEPA